MIKDGLTGIAFTMAMASRSVPSASGFAALSKPIWLSLICRKVKPLGSAARASPIIPTEWGRPPLTVQSTPVPAQTMHSSTSRRPNPCPRSPELFLAMSHSPCGPNGTKWRRIAPLNRRLSQLELYSKKYTVSSTRGFLPKIIEYDGAAARALFSQNPRRTFRKARLANSISQGVGRSPGDDGTPQFLPHRFQIFHFAGTTLASFEMQLAGQ